MRLPSSCDLPNGFVASFWSIQCQGSSPGGRPTPTSRGMVVSLIVHQSSLVLKISTRTHVKVRGNPSEGANVILVSSETIFQTHSLQIGKSALAAKNKDNLANINNHNFVTSRRHPLTIFIDEWVCYAHPNTNKAIKRCNLTICRVLEDWNASGLSLYWSSSWRRKFSKIILLANQIKLT